MKKLISVAILLFLTTNSALAKSSEQNSKNFAGLGVAIGGSAVGTNSKLQHDQTGENGKFSVGDNQFIAVVNASYLKDVNEKWLLGGGITYDLNSLRNGSGHFYDVGLGTYNTSINTKKHFSIYAQPTYAVSETTAVFFKVAYHQAKANISDEYLYSYGVHDAATVHGLGLGIGTMIFLDKNIFTKLEVEHVDYAKVTTPYRSTTVGYKLSTTSGTLSIGYRF